MDRYYIEAKIDVRQQNSRLNGDKDKTVNPISDNSKLA